MDENKALEPEVIADTPDGEINAVCETASEVADAVKEEPVAAGTTAGSFYYTNSNAPVDGEDEDEKKKKKVLKMELALAIAIIVVTIIIECELLFFK